QARRNVSQSKALRARLTDVSQSKALRARFLGVLALGLFIAGCHTDMWVQPHLRAQMESDFANFSDRSASRPVIAGTVARGQAKDDIAYYTGREGGKYITELP